MTKRERERFMGLSFLRSAFYSVVGCLKFQQVMMMKSKTVESDKQTEEEEWRWWKNRGVCRLGKEAKRRKAKIRGQCPSGWLELCLMSGGFCGFFSMHVLWLYLVRSNGRSSWVRWLRSLELFHPSNKKMTRGKARVFSVVEFHTSACVASSYWLEWSGLGLFDTRCRLNWFYLLSSVLILYARLFEHNHGNIFPHL